MVNKKTKPNYTCPRCGFETKRKPDIRRHFNNMNSCPGCVNAIVLTDEIKQAVLENRIYHVEKQPSQQQVINNVVYNYNTFNSIIMKMDPIEKVTNLMRHKNLPVLDFEESVETSLEDKVSEFSEHHDTSLPCQGITLDQNGILDIIDKITSFSNVDHMNIVYDEVPDKIKVFQHGEWKPYIFEAGVDMIISTLKSFYLDYYEIYLIRRYQATFNLFEKQCIKEQLEEYYKFIASFDMEPFVKGCRDGILLENSSKSYSLEERFHPMYTKIKDEIRHTYVTSTKRRVLQLIKKNNKANILELNRQLMDLIRVDEVFKNEILNQISIFQNE